MPLEETYRVIRNGVEVGVALGDLTFEELLALRLAIDVAMRQLFPSLLERMKDAGLAKNPDDPSLHELLIKALPDIFAQWRYAECDVSLYLIKERKRHNAQTADVFEH